MTLSRRVLRVAGASLLLRPQQPVWKSVVAGDKTGNNRWDEENVPVADRLYDEHLAMVKKEGFSDLQECPKHASKRDRDRLR